MSSYFISRPDQNEWFLDIDDFSHRIQVCWPTARVRSYPVQAEWYIEEENFVVIGRLYLSPGPVVCVEGELTTCARFALWYRQQIPTKQTIWFYDEEFSTHVTLDQETTVEQIVSAFED